METLLEDISDTLEELDKKGFGDFKWYLCQPGIVKGLEPMQRHHLMTCDKRKIADLIIQHYNRNGAQILVNILKKLAKDDLVERFLSYQEPIKECIIDVLDKLENADVAPFKLHLQQAANPFGGQPIPKKELDEANGRHTANLILKYYRDRSEQVVVKVLQTIYNNDAATRERLLDILRGSNKKKRKRNQEELRDDPDASTSYTYASRSTTPRTWLSVSKRWRPQLEKLRNMDDSKVKRVQSLVFGEDKEFRIAQGSEGVEVFLGLRDDGTEVAVKRMSKTNDLYKALTNDKIYLRLPELDDPSIVRYVDFVEDKSYGYLALQLCECTLEEHIKTLPEPGRKQLAVQFLNSLRTIHCQDSKILHRDIKPQNVLIDIQGKARLADFGISRRIDIGKTTFHTGAAGTQCWMAKETLDVNAEIGYKRTTDIQPAGMLIYYILSGGHHPFGDGNRCQVNIMDDQYKLDRVEDMVAKDLVEWMIHGEPEKRPKVEQCLAHPFFWTNTRRVEYLSKIGKEEEVDYYQHYRKNNKAKNEEEKKLIKSLKDLISALDQYDEQYAEQGQFNTWKQKFREDEDEKIRQLFEKMDTHMVKKGTLKYSDTLFGLLRCIRNHQEHYADKKDAVPINLMEMFPGLFLYVYKFAEKQGWNSRPGPKSVLDLLLNPEEDTVSAPVMPQFQKGLSIPGQPGPIAHPRPYRICRRLIIPTVTNPIPNPNPNPNRTRKPRSRNNGPSDL